MSCEKKQAYCLVDHANKRGDREVVNPNRTLKHRAQPGRMPGSHGRCGDDEAQPLAVRETA